MITKPNTVLVASAISTVTTDVLGTLVLLDGKTGLPVTDSADLTGITSLQFGVIKEAAVTGGTNAVKRPIYIAKTKAFKKSELVNIISTAGYAATEDSYKLKVPTTPGSAVAGDNLHVRLDFKIEGFRTQKAEEYVFGIADYANAGALATAIAARINNNPETWVTATVANTDEVTITAKKAIDYQPNAKSANAVTKFNQVEFELASYKVNCTGPYSAFGTLTKLANSNPGFGNPYVVRDQEKDAFGYEGSMHSTMFPVMQPATNVATSAGLIDGTVQYNCITFTAELAYRAPDESYMKSTPVTAQLYYPHSTQNALDAAAIVASVKLWANY